MKNQQRQTNQQASLQSILQSNIMLPSNDDDVVFIRPDAERRDSESSPVVDKDHILSILDEALDILLDDFEDDFPSSRDPMFTFPNGNGNSQ